MCKTHALVQVDPADVWRGRKVIQILDDGREVEFPVYRMGKARLAMVPIRMVKSFLKDYPFPEVKP